jgi:hypothetical protein
MARQRVIAAPLDGQLGSNIDTIGRGEYAVGPGSR